jgi:hypothetical protein
MRSLPLKIFSESVLPMMLALPMYPPALRQMEQAQILESES